MNSPHWMVATVALAALVTAPGLARAQVERSGGEPNAALLEQIQQLTSQNASLEAENSRLKRQLSDLSKERDSFKSAAKSAALRNRSDTAALAQSNQQQLAYAKDLKLYKDRMGDLIDRFRATIGELRQAEIDRANEKQALAVSGREIEACMSHNRALIALNEEVLNRWDKQSFWSRLAMTDGFTRIARTRLDNLVDDYKYQAEGQKVTESRLKFEAASLPAPGRAPAAPPATSQKAPNPKGTTTQSAPAPGR